MPHTLTHRRGFLANLAAGAAGLTLLGNPIRLNAAASPDAISPSSSNNNPGDPNLASSPNHNPGDPDAWFGQLKGKHRLILDVPRPNDLMPFAWPRVFLLTNMATGTPEKEINVVVVLRHEGIPYAFEDRIWEKYKFGEMFKAQDPRTKAPSIRNPFWKPAPGEYKLPGFGEVQIGIDQLQASGVMFCVCDAAMTVYSAAVAGSMNADPAEIKKDWTAGLLPGIQPVPSGIWAVGRAQEHGCNYCFAG